MKYTHWLYRSTLLLGILTGCSPVVTVAPPDKPIEINLNVKIEHDLKVKIDKEVEKIINEGGGGIF
ncbi:YnbE family lipoprotein [Magnetococcales bacterium HHB-1]